MNRNPGASITAFLPAKYQIRSRLGDISVKEQASHSRPEYIASEFAGGAFRSLYLCSFS